MTRARLLVFLVVVVIALGGAAAYAGRVYQERQDRIASAPPVATAAPEAIGASPRVVFRNTAIGDGYGNVAMVALDDPAGPRAVLDLSCDRVDATAGAGSCLTTRRGVVTRYDLIDLDGRLVPQGESPLPGIPSRTRLSPDGTLVASTVFVAGHSYLQAGFSTTTTIGRVGGESYGNLERFQLIIGGEEIAPVDRNVWGVTFRDDRRFYATVATGGTPYLVEGDLVERTLTAIHAGVECPALSPDARSLAFKSLDDGGRWRLAVLDLSSGRERVLDGERANVDDQPQWLDDDTVLYGLPRADEAGVTDVWSLDTAAGSAPRLFIEEAWSPAVIRD